jgi:hypothetical protein
VTAVITYPPGLLQFGGTTSVYPSFVTNIQARSDPLDWARWEVYQQVCALQYELSCDLLAKRVEIRDAE